MPTALTSQILGNNGCFEPYMSNIYTRRVLSGKFQVVCPWLLRELVDRGLWDENLKKVLIAHRGSVQNILTIPTTSGRSTRRYRRSARSTSWSSRQTAGRSSTRVKVFLHDLHFIHTDLKPEEILLVWERHVAQGEDQAGRRAAR
ncbi:hypothetical protein B0H12DRAFT_207034 [Mycena haematopus]|nr:hypothetical protein B0H12DRAFT_207034 [Mycena haematopus]